MIAFLRMVADFFKTWFLPSPAHDENEDEVVERESSSSYYGDDAMFDEMEDDDGEDDDPSVNSNKNVRRSGPDERADFSHLVGEPENSDERYSRSKSPGESSEPE